MLGESLETSAVLIQNMQSHADCRDLHLGELGLIGVVEDVWGCLGMFGGLESVADQSIWTSMGESSAVVSR